ncbi:PH domain-containing protein [Polaribacter sp. IC073]|uniref:PH domain-containing protein n=1 Tax=Polaribacter sp. IC073 TaxID=2508540 RepID=UPI0011BF14BB|nr:PH domain-containing protein [Polaribacter sp. IC073]TXD46560.1 PH domain-containing protein [Polaribacter sp. IC073]
MTDSFQNIAVTSFPDVTKIDFKLIDIRYLKVILLNTSLLFIALFIVLFFINDKDIFELAEYSLWLSIAILVAFIVTLFIKNIEFKQRKYAVREKDISYQNGFFFRSLTTVPFNRIQHVEIDEGPISRFFGLVSLSVFTAGDSSDDLKISGLLKEEAQQIKEFISNKIDG